MVYDTNDRQTALRRPATGAPDASRYRLSVLSAAESKGLPSLRDCWESLLRGNDNPYIMYQSPEWWDHLQTVLPPERLRLAIATNCSNDIVGIAPLEVIRYQLCAEVKSRKLLKFSIPAVSILGGQPLLPNDTQLYDSFLRSIADALPGCDGVYLKCVLQGSLSWQYFERAAWHSDGSLVCQPDGVQWLHSLALPHDGEQFLAHFGRKRRYNLKRQLRLLETHGRVEIVRVDGASQVDGFVGHLAAIAAGSWQARRILAAIARGDVGRERFRDLAARGLLRSYLLKCGETPCAYAIGYQLRDVFHYADIAFDERFRSFSPGTTLLYLLVRDLIEHRPPKRINFGIGHSGYKEQFGNAHTKSASILLLRPTVMNRFRRAAHGTFRQIRSWLQACRTTNA